MPRTFRLQTTTALLLLAVLPAGLACADDAPPASQGSALQAIVMDVEGKARWRPSSDAAWRDAKVNDIVDPGTEIRTGLKGRLTLRVGKNATVLVDAGTEFHIPSIVQDGETLRTLATVKSGRVDFKVDKVGYSNDFKVVTPATTLSVRGTGFSLATGPLQGVEVSGVRTNMINAIEVKYVASNSTYFMSGAAQTSSERQDPVQSAWVSTVGPPAVAGTLADKGQLSQQVSQGQSGNAPTNTQSAQQVTGATANGQGGNSLIIASQDPAASEAMKQLAIDVTGSSSVVPAVDPAVKARWQMLDEELAYVRREAPLVLRDLNDSRGAFAGLGGATREITSALAVTEGERRKGFATAFEAKYYADHTAGLREGLRWRWGPEQHPGNPIAGAEATAAVAGVWDAASAPIYFASGGRGEVGEDLSVAVVAADAWSKSSSRGHKIFASADPTQVRPSPTLAEQRPKDDFDDAPNAVQWLENAQTWSLSDRNESEDPTKRALFAAALATATDTSWAGAVQRLADLRDNAEFWRIGSGGSSPAPTMIALKINEVVQRSWDAVVTDVLGNQVGRLHDDVSQGVTHMISALEKRDFAGIQQGVDTYMKAYEIAALADGDSKSAQALAEFNGIVGEVKRQVDKSLGEAYSAARQAGEARSLSQRAFLYAASNAELRQAAEIANRCQQATHGVNGILPNAVAMQSAYVGANQAALAAGAIRPDLASERASTRP